MTARNKRTFYQNNRKFDRARCRVEPFWALRTEPWTEQEQQMYVLASAILGKKKRSNAVYPITVLVELVLVCAR